MALNKVCMILKEYCTVPGYIENWNIILDCQFIP